MHVASFSHRSCLCSLRQPLPTNRFYSTLTYHHLGAGAPGAGISASSELAGRSSAAELGEQLHTGLVRLLVGEAYEATSTYLMGTVPLPVNKCVCACCVCEHVYFGK
eukprot:1159783-Pelagomonas_calceolata.AAC.1